MLLRVLAALLAGAFSIFWLGFFLVGGVAAVDTHFTNAPQQYPGFTITPWEPGAGPDGTPGLTRQAVWPITFHTLRYTQWSGDGGTTIEPVGYYADIRWGRTSAAMLVCALLVLIPLQAARLLEKQRR